METKYYIDTEGNYLGGFAGSIPDNGIEIESPPEHGGQMFVDGEWTNPPVDLKLHGVEFEGVMCSATKEDMWGLSSIKEWVAAGNDVNFEFDNGNVLTLTSGNYAAFEAVWVPFRVGFF